jgi:glutaredoxin 3
VRAAEKRDRAASKIKGENMEVVIYTNTGCSACHQAKEFLAQHNVSFVEKSIAKDPALINELAGMGFRAVPVIRVGNETMLGFSAVKLRRMLGL